MARTKQTARMSSGPGQPKPLNNRHPNYPANAQAAYDKAEVTATTIATAAINTATATTAAATAAAAAAAAATATTAAAATTTTTLRLSLKDARPNWLIYYK